MNADPWDAVYQPEPEPEPAPAKAEPEPKRPTKRFKPRKRDLVTVYVELVNGKYRIVRRCDKHKQYTLYAFGGVEFDTEDEADLYLERANKKSKYHYYRKVTPCHRKKRSKDK